MNSFQKELTELSTDILGTTVKFITKLTEYDGPVEMNTPYALSLKAAENIVINASGIITLLRAATDIIDDIEAESKEATKQ